jgi:hypothetical protein
MTIFTTIASTEVDAESPIVYSLKKRLRDNPLAIAEGAAGAPRFQTAALNQVASAQAVATANIRNADITTAKIGALAVSLAKVSAAISAGLVTNGSSHDHAGGDGGQVNTTSILANTIRNAKIYKGVGHAGVTTIGGNDYLPQDAIPPGLIMLLDPNNLLRLELYTFSWGWRVASISSSQLCVSLIYDGENQRIYNTSGDTRYIYYYTIG